MSARYVSSKLIANVQVGKKSVAVDFVDRTAAWIRPSGYPAQSIRQDFVSVAQKNLSKFKDETVKIAMKESMHESQSDMITHYTAYGLDKDGNVIDVKHLYR